MSTTEPTTAADRQRAGLEAVPDHVRAEHSLSRLVGAADSYQASFSSAMIEGLGPEPAPLASFAAIRSGLDALKGAAADVAGALSDPRLPTAGKYATVADRLAKLDTDLGALWDGASKKLDAASTPPEPDAGDPVRESVAAAFVTTWSNVDPLARQSAYATAPPPLARLLESLPPTLAVVNGSAVWRPAVEPEWRAARWYAEADDKARAKIDGARAVRVALEGFVTSNRRLAVDLRQAAAVAARAERGRP